jgi:hypothetical protein
MKDVELYGTRMPAGSRVLLLTGAANRDERVFAEPDRFDVRREPNEHLALGLGVHFCLGAALARAEIEITLRSLIERFPSLELAGPTPFRDRLTLRGLESLPIACGAQSAVRSRVAAQEVPARCPVAHAPASGVAAKPTSAASGDSVLAVRPAGGDADASWRDALRKHVEEEHSDMNFPSARAGLELAATSALLARTPLFRSCTPIELAELAATSYPISFEAGDLLCTEGGQALECYAIAEGEASVSIGDRTIRTVGPDDVVGERGPIEGGTRTATVRAVTHMITYAISRQRLLALMGRSPAARVGMLQYMKERYRD